MDAKKEMREFLTSRRGKIGPEQVRPDGTAHRRRGELEALVEPSTASGGSAISAVQPR
jgi:hypothetical protein